MRQRHLRQQHLGRRTAQRRRLDSLAAAIAAPMLSIAAMIFGIVLLLGGVSTAGRADIGNLFDGERSASIDDYWNAKAVTPGTGEGGGALDTGGGILPGELPPPQIPPGKDPSGGNNRPEVTMDTTIIRLTLCQLFDLIQGSLGALLAAVAGVGAIVAGAFGAYKSGYSLIVVALGAFAVDTMVGIYFPGIDCSDKDALEQKVREGENPSGAGG